MRFQAFIYELISYGVIVTPQGIRHDLENHLSHLHQSNMISAVM